MNQRTCLHCGSAELVPGSLQSTGAVRFRPNDSRFLTFRTADVAVTTLMCAGCGAVTLFGNLEKLHALCDGPMQQCRGAPSPVNAVASRA